jgi:glycosyltransferase involved in cell wall biosynthesis
MANLVTIGIPLYKRFEYLPRVLEVVAAQDYPSIELIVSDNGRNGPQLREKISALYPKPFRFRQNTETVGNARHFNQIIQEASGEYCLILADDDEISSNYVSELVCLLERHPEASVAMARQEMINERGEVLRKSKERLPVELSGPEFILAAWHSYEFKFECFATFLARTRELQACGGFEEFTRGGHSENALLIKLCLNRSVVFSVDCVFRWRVAESSLGWSSSIRDFGAASREFLRFLRRDPIVRGYAGAHTETWRQLSECLVRMTWQTYFWRWRDLYANKLSNWSWFKAAFALPFIPAYYKEVRGVFRERLRARILGTARSCSGAREFP